MLEWLARGFVGRPLTILCVAALFAVGQILLRFMGRGGWRHPWSLLIVAGAWALYAGWEGLVRWRTPGADIRVDLLVIWPVLAIVSAVFLFRALQRGSR